MGNKQIKILLLYTGSTGFPLGDAYTNRILSFAKGLQNQSAKVKILILFPGKKLGVESPLGGVYGINYEYCCPFDIPGHKFQKIYSGIYGILKAIYLILFKEKGIDSLISFSESIWQNLFIGIFSRLKKIYFIREINEFPRKVLIKGHLNLNLLSKLKIKVSLVSTNAVFYISNGLADYFENILRIKKQSLILPIIVDTSRFMNIDLQNRDVITYCGNLFGEKDGVKILIESFSKIAQKYSKIKLQLIGNTNSKEFLELEEIINILNITEKVIFTGFVERDDIPKYLLESKMLILARPDNIQAKGGFPTKLGEYLATSNPVIVTSVGDIPLYLKDGVNAFLTIPGDVDDLSRKMSFILENYSDAQNVAKEGFKLVSKEFNPDYQAGRIITFIKSQIYS